MFCGKAFVFLVIIGTAWSYSILQEPWMKAAYFEDPNCPVGWTMVEGTHKSYDYNWEVMCERYFLNCTGNESSCTTFKVTKTVTHDYYYTDPETYDDLTINDTEVYQEPESELVDHGAGYFPYYF